MFLGFSNKIVINYVVVLMDYIFKITNAIFVIKLY